MNAVARPLSRLLAGGWRVCSHAQKRLNSANSRYSGLRHIFEIRFDRCRHLSNRWLKRHDWVWRERSNHLTERILKGIWSRQSSPTNLAEVFRQAIRGDAQESIVLRPVEAQ